MLTIIIGIAAFLAAKDLREDLKEMMLVAGILGLIAGLVIGTLAIFLIEPIMSAVTGLLTGTAEATTIAEMMTTGVPSAIIVFFMALIHYTLTSAIVSLVTAVAYGASKRLHKSIEI